MAALRFVRSRNDWLIEGPASALHVGEMVTVGRRDGSSSTVKVTRILDTHKGIAHALFVDTRPRRISRRPKGRRTGCSCGSRLDRYGMLIPAQRNCWTCRHDA